MEEGTVSDKENLLTRAPSTTFVPWSRNPFDREKGERFMPCFTSVKTQIRDLSLGTDAARKVELNPERFGQVVTGVFCTPAGNLQLRQIRGRTHQASGVPRASVYDLTGRYAEEGVLRWTSSRGHFTRAQAGQSGKKVLTLRRY